MDMPNRSTSRRARAVPPSCCDDACPPGGRNNYFIGKRLTPQSYLSEQQFLNGRRHLLNRAIHGWGVVYGFALTINGKSGAGVIRIGEGLALDRAGRELWQVGSIDVELDNLVILDSDGRPLRVDGKLDGRLEQVEANVEDCWLLSAHYAEQSLDPVMLKGDCDCKRKEWDRTCEIVIYSLRKVDCAECCKPYVCELDCQCDAGGGCCGEADDGSAEKEAEVRAKLAELLRQEPRDEPSIAALSRELEELIRHRLGAGHGGHGGHGRGGCLCLCEHLTGLQVGVDCMRLEDVDGCTKADLENGLPLACLRLGRDDCGDWSIGAILDACGPRRLVKRNDLLFDLINGCDLTRIVEIGWAPWHRRDAPPVPFDQFLASLGFDTKEPDYVDYPTTDFWVTFSRPVRVDTIRPDCFTMAVMSDQTEGCWREYYRVPVIDVLPEDEDSTGHARRMRMVVSGAWLRDGVEGDGSIFLRGECYVEIEIRGDFIIDCLGQSVDANPRGRAPIPTGGGEPGDSYLSTFTVARRIPPPPVPRANVQQQRQRAPGTT
ncbi:hypothetical protein [Rhizobium sp. WYJ-E13]|uniref:hypothetical protein n=1 Tax=Rhizobium sp. WYJ-E13 TaxID=2849093 RepID=UPI001C1EB547|nr:hypothetical protein [Rhizobium sp. WYJ-E13]QWW71205.1 hypothetical protein KQ933_31120 [Rhizobium sp. WYJ-E13]